MSVYPKRAAEKVIFRELFWDAHSVALNDGTVVNGPCVVADGITLDGTQYVTYQPPLDFMFHPQWTFILDITPHFTSPDGTFYYLWGATSNTLLNQHPAVNNMFFSVNGVTILNPVSPAVNGVRKRLTLSIYNGAGSRAYEAGVQTDTGSSAYTRVQPTNWVLGATFSGALPFKGIIHEVSVLARPYTVNDAAAEVSPGGMFGYHNQAQIHLDFNEPPRTIAGVKQVPDKARSEGNTWLLGDGAGNLEPSWAGDHMVFDGANNVVPELDLSIDNLLTWSFVVELEAASTTTTGFDTVFAAKSSRPGGYALSLQQSGALWYVYFATNVDVSIGANRADVSLGKQLLICTYDGTTSKLYLNGLEVDSDAVTQGTGLQHDIAGFFVGASSAAGGGAWAGKVYNLRLYDRVLSSIQRDDLAQELGR